MIERINLKKVYSSSKHNLVRDFYNPVLENAVEYKRITGYFSPKVLALAARGISRMLSNGGSMEIISSIQINSETFNAIEQANEDIISEHIDMIFTDPDQLQAQLEKDYYSLFILLLQQGFIKMKIALVKDDVGILHEKIGIIKDVDGKSLSFSGSNNETVYGWTHNIEQLKVFPQWDIATSEFYQQDLEEFESLWNDNSPAIKVLEVNDAIKNKLLEIKPTHENIPELIERIAIDEAKKPVVAPVSTTQSVKRNIRDYQLEAIEHWRSEDYVSVFEMATGTGKTFTSISALIDFRQATGSLHGVIVVPLVTLVEQWKEDISRGIHDISIIIASSANPHWKSDLRSLNISRSLGNATDYLVITTYSTFTSEAFTSFMDSLADEDVVLVADEMHNLVTTAALSSAQHTKYKYKLGLSATPTRLWKQSESAIAMQLFGNNPYVYSLDKAIENKFLVPFNYYIRPVYLTAEEYEEYCALSKEISRLATYASTNQESSAYTMALMKRSRIKKQAENKFQVLDILIKKLRDDHNVNNTLIYTDSNEFLTKAQLLLTDNHIISTKFTGQESIHDRLQIISNLRAHKINAIIAIKCLDEGVDIPSAVNGIFLANNTDPREYVQRLGRVLRLDDEGGKTHANIYDFIVIPPSHAEYSDTVGRNMVKNELIRATFFKKLAMNKSEVEEGIGVILDTFGYYFEENELSYDQSEETS